MFRSYLLLSCLGSYAAELLENATSVSGEAMLTCDSENCECSDTDSSRISCFYMDESFLIPKEISGHLRSVTIQGMNFSVHIPDQEYSDSWSMVESFEIVRKDGDDKHELNLPYNFTRKLGRVKVFRMRNTGLISIEGKAFRNMTALEHLDLSRNKFLNLRSLDLAMVQRSLANLNVLNISRIHSGERMSLYNIKPSLFHSISAIKTLDISWTRIVSLKRLEILSNLETLNISGTPILFNDETCLETILLLKNLTVWRMEHWPR